VIDCQLLLVVPWLPLRFNIRFHAKARRGVVINSLGLPRSLLPVIVVLLKYIESQFGRIVNGTQRLHRETESPEIICASAVKDKARHDRIKEPIIIPHLEPFLCAITMRQNL